MFFAKIIAATALMVAVSASSLEYVCVKGQTATLGSYNDYQKTPCMTIPLSSATNKWGGGKSSCNAGTFEEYWNISSTGAVWLCYGKTSTCKPRQAKRNVSWAEMNGYDKCWMLTI